MKKLYPFLFLLLTTPLFSQTGPGGVGNSSNNVIWLNGDIFTYSTDPNISSWDDQSGNSNDFIQNNSSNQPSRSTYSGFYALRFDGADFIRRGATAGLNANTNTQYIVYNGYRPNHVGILYESSFTQSSQFFRTFRLFGNVKSWVLDASLNTVSNQVSNSSAFQIVSSVWDGNAQTYQSYKDGSLIGSQIGANGNPTGNNSNTIGAASNNSYKFDGDIGEVIVFNTAINSAQRNIIDNYLSSKYSISIANDMYTYDGTHKYQLFGIGQESDGNNLTAQGAGVVEISVGSLNDGDYILAGHNNNNLSITTNDVPPSIAGGSRLSRTWRSSVSGTPGTVDIVYDVSSITSLPSGSYYLLVESNNGVFNDGDVVTYGPFADAGGLVTFSGVTLAEGDYFTLASGFNGTIISINSGGWFSPTTWNCNCVPTSTDDVIVSSGHSVVAKTTTSVNNLTIEGTLNASPSGSFSIKGDLVVNSGGVFTSKVVYFNGTSAQNMTNSSSTISFQTLIMNNSNGLSIQSGSFSVSNSITVTNGSLQNVGGTFTLLSTSSNTAVIINGSGGFSGEFVVQRFISQRNASWGDLSSPVSGNHLRDWDSNPAGSAPELLMCGVSGISGECGGWNSVYDYNEVTQAYDAVTDTSYALATGYGIELWLEDTLSTLYDKTFDSRGTPNYGDIVVPVQTSWNLLGNPYQAWINYSTLTKPTISGAYYIWNTNNGSYDVAFSGSIPPNQAFWVESTGAGNVTFSESDKLGSGSSVFYKQANDGYVESILKVKSNETEYAHELKIHLNPMAMMALDNYDASFKASRIIEAPSITAISSNSSKPLSIISFNKENNINIPITITGVEGNYFIEAISFENLNNEYKVVELVDSKTNKTYDLKNVQKIEVYISNEEDENRFQLNLSNDIYGNVLGLNGVNIYKNSEFTIIEFDNVLDQNYQVSIVNMLGQKIINDYTNINTNKLLIPNNQIPKGLNVVSVRSKNGNLIRRINY